MAVLVGSHPLSLSICNAFFLFVFSFFCPFLNVFKYDIKVLAQPEKGTVFFMAFRSNISLSVDGNPFFSQLSQ